MSTHVSRATNPAADRELWRYAEPTRGIAVRLVWQWVGAAIANGVAAARKRHLLRRAERELHCLDDRLLKDIGVTRYEIGSVTRFGRASRAPSPGWLPR
jgi:uncharacterized protein YjiS (DUF1127 family)